MKTKSHKLTNESLKLFIQRDIERVLEKLTSAHYFSDLYERQYTEAAVLVDNLNNELYDLQERLGNVD